MALGALLARIRGTSAFAPGGHPGQNAPTGTPPAASAAPRALHSSLGSRRSPWPRAPGGGLGDQFPTGSGVPVVLGIATVGLAAGLAVGSTFDVAARKRRSSRAAAVAVCRANPTATCRTSIGDFKLEVFLDKMPITASNFIDLVARGFYNGLHVHRVIPGFMVQLGCPYTKDPHSSVAGMGGPLGKTDFRVFGTGRSIRRSPEGNIPDEFTQRISNTRMTVAMANQGKYNSGGSQFFINMNDNSYLDWYNDRTKAKHPVFARITDGWNVILRISLVERDEKDLPIDPVRLISITMDED